MGRLYKHDIKPYILAVVLQLVLVSILTAICFTDNPFNHYFLLDIMYTAFSILTIFPAFHKLFSTSDILTIIPFTSLPASLYWCESWYKAAPVPDGNKIKPAAVLLKHRYPRLCYSISLVVPNKYQMDDRHLQINPHILFLMSSSEKIIIYEKKQRSSTTSAILLVMLQYFTTHVAN